SAEILSGVRHGLSTGAPISLLIRNRDFENWQHVMASQEVDKESEEVRAQELKKKIGRFRPGHADLAGTLKFKHKDIRDVLERASARETAARVAAGSVCEQLLAQLGIEILSHVIAIGPVKTALDSEALSFAEIRQKLSLSEMSCLDGSVENSMKEHIKAAWQDGDSVGGILEVLVDGLPVGLGSYTQWDEKLDGQLSQALMSIQAIKAVEFGDGVESAQLPGSKVHDALYPRAAASGDLPFSRLSNHAGGIEGGMTNGARLRVRAYMKPIPTLRKGLPSLSFPEYQAETAHYERSDVCAVPAASVVAKAMTAIILCRALVGKFGADNFIDLRESLERNRRWCAALSAESASLAAQEDGNPEMELE
ncbi:MAG: chorismate synthase, partial [Candidatus Obscuribacterales bacterium]|nr:chorismate synthase [Candidatus Obscuribacterales bacterium]